MRVAARLIFILFVVIWFFAARNHRTRFQPAVPPPSVQSGNVRQGGAGPVAKLKRGFNNRQWYGRDMAKEIDPLLTRRNFLIVLDGSGSMADSQCSGNLSKIVAAKQAIAAFATKLKPEDNLGLCAFDSRGVTERSPLSLNRAAFNQALQAVRSDSNTPLGTAVSLGYSRLQTQAQRQGKRPARHRRQDRIRIAGGHQHDRILHWGRPQPAPAGADVVSRRHQS